MDTQKQTKDHITQLTATKDDELLALADAFNIMGNSSSFEETVNKTNLAREHTSQIMDSDRRDLEHAKSVAQKEKNILTAIKGIKPQDPMESMLASQMIISHNAAMKAFAKAESYNMHQDIAYKKLSQATLSTANKLLRTYAIQMETLNRYRGKGQQRITVEHININDGGKAVIGNISSQKVNKGDG